MSELLKFITEIEWIALGIIFFVGLLRWNKRLSELYDELRNTIEEDKNGNEENL